MATREELFNAVRLIKEHCTNEDCLQCKLTQICTDCFLEVPKEWPVPENGGNKIMSVTCTDRSCEFCKNYGCEHPGGPTISSEEIHGEGFYPVCKSYKQKRRDEVEVVRCKDCKHWEDNRGYCEVWEYYISNQDYFCGSGERGTDSSTPLRSAQNDEGGEGD